MSQYVEPRPWDEIEEFYRKRNENSREHHHMLALVKYIRAKGLNARLFAYTSHDTLMVSIYDPIELNREMLKLEFDRQRQLWRFEYFSRPFEEAEFVREYTPELGCEKFDQFISMMGW